MSAKRELRKLVRKIVCDGGERANGATHALAHTHEQTRTDEEHKHGNAKNGNTTGAKPTFVHGTVPTLYVHVTRRLCHRQQAEAAHRSTIRTMAIEGW